MDAHCGQSDLCGTALGLDHTMGAGEDYVCNYVSTTALPCFAYTIPGRQMWQMLDRMHDDCLWLTMISL